MRFFIFILFISTYSYAQLSETISFEHSKILETISNIHTLENDKLISVSTIYSSPTGQAIKDIEVSKLSPCNEIVWSKNYSDPTALLEHRQMLQEHGTNNVFIIGFYTPNTNQQKYLYVQKLDADGDILFSKSYDFGSQIMGNAYTNFSTSTGILITAKYSPLGGGGSYTTLISIKNNGDIEYAFRQKNTFTGISAAQVDDDVFFIRSANVIYLTHKDGTVYWAKTYPYLLQSSNFFNALFVDDGYIIPVRRNAEYYLVKVDLNGEYIWKTDLKPTGYWPVLYSINNTIYTASFSNINGGFKPILITYDKNGSLINEQVFNNLNVDVYGTPSVCITDKNRVDIAYASSSTGPTSLKGLIFSENAHESACLEDYTFPEVENLISPLWNADNVQSIPLPLDHITDHQITVTDITLSDSVRCSSVIIPDSTYVNTVLDCDTGYTYYGSDVNATYYWPIDGSTDPNKHFTSTGVYEVIVERCHAITHEFINIKDYCECDLFVPNAFSPNNDGLNDTFGGVDNCGITYYKLEIYDRWGKRIFTSNDINIGWDGRYKQNYVKSDVYFYKIEYTPVTGNSVSSTTSKQGPVLLIY